MARDDVIYLRGHKAVQYCLAKKLSRTAGRHNTKRGGQEKRNILESASIPIKCAWAIGRISRTTLIKFSGEFHLGRSCRAKGTDGQHISNKLLQA